MDIKIEKEVIVWLKDGPYRIKILNILKNNSLLSSEIASRLKIHRSSTSRLLKKLNEKELIEKISSHSRTVEYFMTSKGEKYLDYLGDFYGSS